MDKVAAPHSGMRAAHTEGVSGWLTLVIRPVAGYLAAIVAANLSVTHWGPTAAVYNAFLFIGLDLTCRDRLHDLWHGRLLRNMALLIVAGSVLSYVCGLLLGSGPQVGRIALASCIAFGAAATA